MKSQRALESNPQIPQKQKKMSLSFVLKFLLTLGFARPSDAWRVTQGSLLEAALPALRLFGLVFYWKYSLFFGKGLHLYNSVWPTHTHRPYSHLACKADLGQDDLWYLGWILRNSCKRPNLPEGRGGAEMTTGHTNIGIPPSLGAGHCNIPLSGARWWWY